MLVTSTSLFSTMEAAKRTEPSTTLVDTPPPAECELCYAHGRRVTAGFVHVHYPREHDCVSAAYGEDGAAFLHYIEDRATTMRYRQSGQPRVMPATAHMKHKRLSNALDGALEEAFHQVGLPRPPSIAVPVCEPSGASEASASGSQQVPIANRGIILARAAPSRAEETRELQEATLLLKHSSLSDERHAPEQNEPGSEVATTPSSTHDPTVRSSQPEAQATSPAGASDHAELPPPASQAVWGRSPMFRGEFCARCCIDTRSWVHVHLPTYGLCWTFRWVRGSRRQLSRLGTHPGVAQVDMSTEQTIQLRAALETRIRIRLWEFYGQEEFLEVLLDPERRKEIWRRKGVDVEAWERNAERRKAEKPKRRKIHREKRHLN